MTRIRDNHRAGVPLAAGITVAVLLGCLILGGACDGEDPDPCDPQCPAPTENPSGN